MCSIWATARWNASLLPVLLAGCLRSELANGERPGQEEDAVQAGVGVQVLEGIEPAPAAAGWRVPGRRPAPAPRPAVASVPAGFGGPWSLPPPSLSSPCKAQI